MAGTFLRGLIDELRDEAVSVAGEEGGGADDAFLRVLVGDEVEVERVDVAAEAGFGLELVVRGQAAETVHLVAHLGSGDGGGAAEAGVKLVHPLDKAGEFFVEGVAGGGELALAFDGDGAGAEALGELVGMRVEDVVELDLVTGENGCDGRLDERGAEARDDGSGATENRVVDDL